MDLKSVRYLRMAMSIVMLPLVCAICALELIGWRSGATTPLHEVAAVQQRDPNVVWLGPFRDYAPYKLERVAIEQPEILIIGSSRCSYLRAAIFRPYKAYNACLTVWALDQVLDFIDRATKAHTPRIVIVALDYFLFNDLQADRWRQERWMDYRQGIWSHKKKLHDLFESARNLNWKGDPIGTSREYLSNLFFPTYDKSGTYQLIGPVAIVNDYGFRSDGSVLTPGGYRATAVANNALGGRYVDGSFLGGKHMSQHQIDRLSEIAELAKARGFQLVGMEFPILKSAVDFLDSDPNCGACAGIWREFQSESTRRLFSEMGLSFFDLSRDPVGEDSRHFVDPVHPAEGGLLGAFARLARDEGFRRLLPQIDVSGLDADYKHVQASGEYFDIYR
jgi:hypothetical protein